MVNRCLKRLFYIQTDTQEVSVLSVRVALAKTPCTLKSAFRINLMNDFPLVCFFSIDSEESSTFGLIMYECIEPTISRLKPIPSVSERIVGGWNEFPSTWEK